MPELPEVQTIVDSLRPLLVGRTFTRIHLARPDIVRPVGIDLPAKLRRRSVTHITRRAKRIVFTLDDGAAFYIHLGMSGQLTIEDSDHPTRPHTHLRIRLTAGGDPAAPPRELRELRFRDPRRFGGIFWIANDHPLDTNLGPEPLTLRPAALAARLARTRRPIKSALLDQTLIAGLGNIYVDEALFRARIHPLTPADHLSSEHVARLNRAIKHTLHRAIRHGGSSLRDYIHVNGNSGQYQNLHQVYGKESHPCPRCQTPITRITISARSTHFCPTCQPIHPSERHAIPIPHRIHPRLRLRGSSTPGGGLGWGPIAE